MKRVWKSRSTFSYRLGLFIIRSSPSSVSMPGICGKFEVLMRVLLSCPASEQFDVVAFFLHFRHEAFNRFLDRNPMHYGIEHRHFFGGGVFATDAPLQFNPFAGIEEA